MYILHWLSSLEGSIAEEPSTLWSANSLHAATKACQLRGKETSIMGEGKEKKHKKGALGMAKRALSFSSGKKSKLKAAQVSQASPDLAQYADLMDDDGELIFLDLSLKTIDILRLLPSFVSSAIITCIRIAVP